MYFLRSKGLLNGLATGTNWVFRDESAHIAFAFEVIATIRREEAELFDAELERRVALMMEQAIECEMSFAEDLLSQGVAGLSLRDMRAYLEFIADQRFAALRMPQLFGARNPFSFMNLQDVQELTNFFERRASAIRSASTARSPSARSFELKKIVTMFHSIAEVNREKITLRSTPLSVLRRP